MDNLKSLMDQKQFDLVLKLTETSTNPVDLFYRISAFLASSRLDDALEVINKNQKILEKNLSSLIKVHIEILCLLCKFDEARKKLDYYANLPYESQVVEETLRDMPKVIETEEKKMNSFRTYSNDQLIEKLESDNDTEVLMALDMVRERDGLTFLPYVAKILVNYPKQSIRSFALLLLVQKEIDRELKFKSIDKVISVNPKQLKPPFTGDGFNELVNKMQNEYKDPSLAENAIQILSSYLIYIYPAIINQGDDALIAALYFIALSYLSRSGEADIEEYCLAHHLDHFVVEGMINEINKALDNF